MNCLSGENVCSVKKENGEGYYRIHTIWSTDGFRINIASKNASWTGEMSPGDLRKISDELQIDVPKYIAECKEALTTDNGKQGYSYAVENGCFTWKKIIDEDSGIKLKMGSVILQLTSFVDVIQTMVDLSLNCKKHLQNKVNNLEQENKNLSERMNLLQSKLADLSDVKSSMEINLYHKFLLLLNTKKKKIQELEASLINFREKFRGGESIKNCETLNEPAAAIPSVYELDTDDDGHDIDDNDHDMPKIQQKVVKKTLNTLMDTKLERKSDCKKSSGNSDIINEQNLCKKLKVDKKNADKNVHVEKHLEGNKYDFERELTNSHEEKSLNENFPSTKDGILDFFFG